MTPSIVFFTKMATMEPITPNKKRRLAKTASGLGNRKYFTNKLTIGLIKNASSAAIKNGYVSLKKWYKRKSTKAKTMTRNKMRKMICTAGCFIIGTPLIDG